ncbi:MAG: hypothetical protein EPN88_00140 [Bacteroidetes bacterium]|nr:MAG: hypothetical protein EPN88_00140 [Bacteroidota bacterium]
MKWIPELIDNIYGVGDRGCNIVPVPPDADAIMPTPVLEFIEHARKLFDSSPTSRSTLNELWKEFHLLRLKLGDADYENPERVRKILFDIALKRHIANNP